MRLLLTTLLLLAAAAQAQGAVVREGALPAKFLALARQEVARAREAAPEAFTAVATVRRELPQLDARKRGPLAPVTPRLAALGPRATWALVHALAFDGALDPALRRTAHVAWQAGLLEALGRARDERVLPLLQAAARDEALGPEVVRAAAEALGALGSDAAVAALLELARRPGAHRAAMLSGLGSCRRLAMAEFLADALASADTDAERLALVKALSRLGNAWALETPAGAPVKAEVPRLRAVAARALVALFARSAGNVRQQAADAVLVVAAPETPALLAEVRGSDAAAVDALSQRFLARAR